MSLFNVLIIEDEEANAMITEQLMRRILASKAFSIFKAADAESGIALAYDCHPSLILMDIHLPGMDGIEATQVIKLDPLLKGVPVVAVTAMSSYTRQQLQERGFEDLILKPVAFSRLVAVVKRLAI